MSFKKWRKKQQYNKEKIRTIKRRKSELTDLEIHKYNNKGILEIKSALETIKYKIGNES